jgi:RHS repeat-associated protein
METAEDDTGHELDDETGMHYAGARYYMSALGRWNGPDPLADDVPAWSPQAYSYNNPIGFMDPTGMAPQSCPPNCNFEGVMRSTFGWAKSSFSWPSISISASEKSIPKEEMVTLDDVQQTDPSTSEGEDESGNGWVSPVTGRLRNDDAVDGHFGASRDGGTRPHTGVDEEAPEGSTIVAPSSGTATQSGSGAPVVIFDDPALDHWIGYYGNGTVSGDVEAGDSVGVMPNMTSQYPNATGMTNHIHNIVVDSSGQRVDAAERLNVE